MDLQKRQMLQQALTRAIEEHGFVAIKCTDDRLLMVQCDLTCFENHVEAVGEDGQPIELRYEEIAAVSAGR